MAIRFHLDENVSGIVATALVRRGVDVSTAWGAGLLGAGDLQQVAFALAHSRVLVTHDDDFTRIHAEGTLHAGICYCHKDKYLTGDLIRLLLLMNDCFDSEEMQNRLEYL